MAAAIEQPRNLVNTPEDVSSINKYVKNLGLSQALGEAGLPINATEIETAKFQSNFESLLADQRLNEYARGTITRPLLVAGLNANQTQAKMAEIKSYDLIDCTKSCTSSCIRTIQLKSSLTKMDFVRQLKNCFDLSKKNLVKITTHPG
jgi:hypothetical protein